MILAAVGATRRRDRTRLTDPLRHGTVEGAADVAAPSRLARAQETGCAAARRSRDSARSGSTTRVRVGLPSEIAPRLSSRRCGKPCGAGGPRWSRGSLFAVAATARILFVRSVWPHPAVRYPVLDCLAYHDWALAILGGDWLGDRVYYQDPLYPFFLAGLYALFGPDTQGVLIAQALLGAASVVVIFALGRQLGGESVGLVAGLLAAVYQVFFFFEALLLKGTLAVFVFSVGAAAGRARGRRRLRLALAAGRLLRSGSDACCVRTRCSSRRCCSSSRGATPPAHARQRWLAASAGRARPARGGRSRRAPQPRRRRRLRAAEQPGRPELLRRELPRATTPAPSSRRPSCAPTRATRRRTSGSEAERARRSCAAAERGVALLDAARARGDRGGPRALRAPSRAQARSCSSTPTRSPTTRATTSSRTTSPASWRCRCPAGARCCRSRSAASRSPGASVRPRLLIAFFATYAAGPAPVLRALAPASPAGAGGDRLRRARARAHRRHRCAAASGARALACDRVPRAAGSASRTCP